MPTFIGTIGDDVITGTTDNDVMDGLAGNDVLDGLAGDDEISGSGGSDDIAGGSGADILRGGDGDDFLYSGERAAPFDLGLEHDQLFGGTGNDRLSAGYGDDVDGGIGNDLLRLSLAGLGQGIVFDTAGIVSGQPFSLGGGTISGIETFAYLRGTEFSDTLTIATQVTTMIVDAGAGDDVIITSASAVSASGGDGNDRFISGMAGNSFNGGSGADTVDYRNATSGVSVTLLNAGQAGTGGGGDQLTLIENVDGSAFADTLNGNDISNDLSGSDGDDTLNGNGGSDRLFGGTGNDTLDGGTGNDLLDGGSGADAMTGGLGDDTFVVDDAGDTVSELFGEGTDTVISSITFDLAARNIENLTLAGIAAIDARGDGRDNILTGNAAANTLVGLAGNDRLVGADGNDVLLGGNGNDTLTGGAGIDSRSGGAGADTYIDTAAGLNGDTIADFASNDVIVFTDADLASFRFSLSGNTLSYSGGALTFATRPGFQLQASAAVNGGVQLTLSTTPVANDVRNDFNGDGLSDVLLRNSNGTITNWLGQDNGGFFSNHAVASYPLPTDWQVAATGDFNGDGRDDVLLRNSNGTITNWLGQDNGGFFSNHAVAAYPLPTDWQVAATGDFNGDGRDDVLLRNSNGTITNWLGQDNGGFFSNHAVAAYPLPTDWQVAATGDFNGDGRDDVLLRNSNGTITNWLGQDNGGFFSNHAVASYPLPTDWQVAATGDFNGDGRDDVLLRNSNGTITNWLGQDNGGFFSNHAVASYPLPTDWQVAATGDFNGDGRDDVLLRNSNGTITNWLGQDNGGFFSNHAVATYPLPTDWQVQSPDILA